MICVDACFMKGKWDGQLHVVVARDGNNDIYLIAYATCKTETRDTWTWFLRILLDDIGYEHEHMRSFMSDRQKVIFNDMMSYDHLHIANIISISFLLKQGLLDALDDLMLGLEHRYCVKHLHTNFKTK
jgi:hypothetical protein